MNESEKTIVACPNCGKKSRVPADKHLLFTCPQCQERIEVRNGQCCSTPKQPVPPAETPDPVIKTDTSTPQNEEEKEGFIGGTILWIATFLVSLPLYIWVRNIVPDLDWILRLDRILEFTGVWLIVSAITHWLRGFIYVIFGIVLILLTIGTFKADGYGFKDLTTDYCSLVYNMTQPDGDEQLVITPSSLQDLPYHKKIKKAVDPADSLVRSFAVKAAAESPFGECANEQHSDEMRQIILALGVFKEVNRNWTYVDDPRGREYFSTSRETVRNRTRNGKFAGDCEDHAILMAAAVLAIGAKPCIVLTQGHAYPELFLGSRSNAEKTNYLIQKDLFPEFDRDAFNCRVDKDGNYWLNLDYTAHYPGGKYLETTICDIIQF